MILPEIDALTRPYWEGAKARRLLLQHCSDCAHVWHPPAPACSACGGAEHVWREARGAGTVHSFAIVRESPDLWLAERVPLVIALVRLDEGPLMIANIVGCPPEDVRVSMPVAVEWEELTPEVVLPQFSPRG